jgi:hypothetical protein
VSSTEIERVRQRGGDRAQREQVQLQRLRRQPLLAQSDIGGRRVLAREPGPPAGARYPAQHQRVAT